VAELPIAILSHMQHDEYITKGINLGANDFITKPFDLVLLERDLMALTGRTEHGHSGERL